MNWFGLCRRKMHTPDSKCARQRKTFQNIRDLQGHCLVKTILARGGIGANLIVRFPRDLGMDLRVDLGVSLGVDLDGLSIDLADFFSLGIENLKKNRNPLGAETRPTKFDKKYEK